MTNAFIAGKLQQLVVLVVAALPLACIKQTTTPGAVVAPSPAPAATPPPAATAGYGTAKYGEVPGAAVVGTDESPNATMDMHAFTLQGDPGKVTLTYVPVEGQAFAQALRAEVKEVPKNPWDFQVLVHNSKPIKRGDVLLATFYLRTEKSREESGEGQTEFVFELGHDPWTKSVSFPVRAARDWKKVHVPFTAQMNHPAGDAKINFRLGFLPQTIEIGGVRIENFGRALALSALPVLKLTYPGIEPDAAWRKAAAERIEKLRKAGLEIVVKDKSGQFLIGAQVRARLVKHAFGFGTCIDPQKLTGPDAAKYKQSVTELFNVATLENNLKWQPLAGDWGGAFTLDRAKAGIDWLRLQGLAVRGHVLIWPGWRNLPRALKAHAADPPYLRRAAEDHIREVAGAVKGTVVHWDVINEPFDNHDLIDILGEDAMVDWFKLARSVDPGAKLFINDYAILSGGPAETPHRAHYEKTIKFLIDKKAPLDGIGVQGHFGSALTGPADLVTVLDRYAKFKKPIWVTEFDFEIQDEELTGKFTHDFFTTMFSHPAVQGVVMWGFWDGAHWKNNAPIYRRDWSLKPSGEAYRKLVLETWRTDATGKTDAEGKFGTRGFLGDYVIDVSFAARKKTATATLQPGGSAFTVVLD